MDSDELKRKLEEVVLKAVSSGIKSSDIVFTMYRQFYDSCNASAERIKADNKLVMEALEAIAQAFSIDLSRIYGTEEKVTALKRAIIKKSETDQPKQRYLMFSYSDDYGHSYCSCVNSKDFKFVDEIINMHDQNESFEHLYDESSILIKAISKMSSVDVGDLLNLLEDKLLDKAKEFFKIIIEDAAVSREEFSEYLACLLCDPRSSGRSKSWVVI